MKMELNKIYNMDCIKGMKLIPDKFVDLIVTDPPYNFEAFGGGFYDLKCKAARTYLSKLESLNCNEFNPEKLLQEAKRMLKKFNGIFFCNKYLILNYLQFAKENDYLFDIHFMNKSNPIPAKNNHFLHDTEYIIVIKEKSSYFDNTQLTNMYKKINKSTTLEGSYHPAEKPIRIIRKYITILSKANDIICDPFIGSGTTALAAKQLGRNYIGFEIEKKYCDIANERLKELSIKQWF